MLEKKFFFYSQFIKLIRKILEGGKNYKIMNIIRWVWMMLNIYFKTQLKKTQFFEVLFQLAKLQMQKHTLLIAIFNLNQCN
jgi:hypothetical protein